MGPGGWGWNASQNTRPASMAHLYLASFDKISNISWLKYLKNEDPKLNLPFKCARNHMKLWHCVFTTNLSKNVDTRQVDHFFETD